MKTILKNGEKYMVLGPEDLQLLRGEINLIVDEKVKRERLDNIVTLDVFNRHAEQVDKRFEDLIHYMDKRFEAVDKRFEAVDKRFEDLISNMNSRFEAVDKRFEAVDKRFEDLIGNMNSRFEQANKDRERLYRLILWVAGLGFTSTCGIFTAIAGIYFKLFF